MKVDGHGDDEGLQLAILLFLGRFVEAFSPALDFGGDGFGGGDPGFLLEESFEFGIGSVLLQLAGHGGHHAGLLELGLELGFDGLFGVGGIELDAALAGDALDGGVADEALDGGAGGAGAIAEAGVGGLALIGGTQALLDHLADATGGDFASSDCEGDLLLGFGGGLLA